MLSTELREFADTQLLFWSSFDFVFDAALNFFGPIDNFLRFGSSSAGGEDRECCSSSSTTTTATSVSEQLIDSTSTLVTHNHELFREARNVLSNLIQNVFHKTDEKDVLLEGGEHGSRCSTHHDHSSDDSTKIACDRNAESEEWEETQNRNHSSLQVRGGGFGRRGDGGQQKFQFSLYQEGDGSEKDPDGIPTRYLDMHAGNREKAEASLAMTLEWRKENKIDSILARPHSKFDICKQVFPTSFLGRDPQGHVIFLQRPALIDIELAKRNKIKKEELLEHYIYMNEYLWQVLEGDKPLGTMVSILDLTGLNMGVLRKRDYVAFFKLFVSVMDSHYPQRAHKTLVINSPKWVNTLYRIVSPVLRQETKSRIEILSKGKKQDDVLKRYLGPKAAQLLPKSFWSSSSSSNSTTKGSKAQVAPEEEEESKYLPESELDAKLRTHVISRNHAGGKKMYAIA